MHILQGTQFTGNWDYEITKVKLYKTNTEIKGKLNKMWSMPLMKQKMPFQILCLTIAILYPDHKIPAGVCYCFHDTTWILFDWSLCKQLSCKEQIYTKQSPRVIFCYQQAVKFRWLNKTKEDSTVSAKELW